MVPRMLWRFGRGVRRIRRWLLRAGRCEMPVGDLVNRSGAAHSARRGRGGHAGVNAASERALEKVQVALSQVQWVVK